MPATPFADRSRPASPRTARGRRSSPSRATRSRCSGSSRRSPAPSAGCRCGSTPWSTGSTPRTSTGCSPAGSSPTPSSRSRRTGWPTTGTRQGSCSRRAPRARGHPRGLVARRPVARPAGGPRGAGVPSGARRVRAPRRPVRRGLTGRSTEVPRRPRSSCPRRSRRCSRRRGTTSRARSRAATWSASGATSRRSIVELKRTFSLALVHQGIDRLALSDAVYLAVGAWPAQAPAARRLCRRLGLGLIVVADGAGGGARGPAAVRAAQVRAPRRPAAARAPAAGRRPDAGRLDPGPGHDRVPAGGPALRPAARRRPAAGRASCAPSADVPNAGRILRDDVYGWFERVAPATYALTPARARRRAWSGPGQDD